MNFYRNKTGFFLMFIFSTLLLGKAMVCRAEVDEYEVFHNITVNLDGGECDGIFYVSCIDHGEEEGNWYNGLCVGSTLLDKYGAEHEIIDYDTPNPIANGTISGYFDCVGLTPYICVSNIRRSGYEYAGCSARGSDSCWCSGNSIFVEIGAYTDTDIVLTVSWNKLPEIKPPTFYAHYLNQQNVGEDVSGRLPEDEAFYANESHIFNGTRQTIVRYNSNGYQFAGWGLSAGYCEDIFTYDRPAVFSSSNDINFYAQWSYTVTFNPNCEEFEGSMSNLNPIMYHTFSLPSNQYTRKGYIFDGWCTTKTGKTRHYPDQTDNLSFTPDKDGYLTLYAMWKPIDVTIRLYPNKPASSTEPLILQNGSYPYIDNQYYEIVKPYDELENVPDISQLYSIRGWSPLNWSLEQPDGNIDLVCLYANWRENTYRIIFNTNGGSTIPPIIVSYEEYIYLPEAPERAGFSFAHWQSDINELLWQFADRSRINKLTDIDNASIALVAVWRHKNVKCLAISSPKYRLINSSAQNIAPEWYDSYVNSSKNPLQIWEVNKKYTQQLNSDFNY